MTLSPTAASSSSVQRTLRSYIRWWGAAGGRVRGEVYPRQHRVWALAAAAFTVVVVCVCVGVIPQFCGIEQLLEGPLVGDSGTCNELPLECVVRRVIRNTENDVANLCCEFGRE